jgi:uncharacterized RmlC-like cupin family protein
VAPQSTSPSESVAVFRDGLLIGDCRYNFAVGSLAESTHLPTGTASDRSDVVTIPPGGDATALAANGEATLLCVTLGQLQLQWGRDPERVTTAGSGDTVLVPAGIPCSVRNASAVEILQFVRVLGG